MSVFTEEPNQAPTETGQQTAQTTESFVSKLVETKGDNFRDPEVIAKSKLEADVFIKDLERQNKELREDLSKQDYAKDLLTQLQDKATATANVIPVESNNNNISGTEAGNDTKSPVSGDELESLITQTLTKRAAESKKQGNLQLVDKKLDELYGTNALSVIEQKGAALGLTKEYLQTMAGDSPAAFFTLIGEEAPKVINPVGQSTVNTAGVYNQTADRDYNYYSKIRKENPSLYYSPKVQREMADDATRLGGKFGL
mgnify:CR=1 FL=1